MSICSDLIDIEASEDWQLLTSQSFVATKPTPKTHIPIPAKDLAVSTNAEYLAAIVNINEGKPTWLFGGDITQTYSFGGSSGSPSTAQVQSQPLKLFVNRLQLIPTPRYSIENYKIRYQPPYWFKDATIRIFKYTGEASNFVKDTLFDIGNTIGIPASGQVGSLTEKIDGLITSVGDSFAFLEEDIRNLARDTNSKNTQLLIKLRQTDAGIYTLGEGLSEILPPGYGDQLKTVLINRLNLDLGFL